MIRRNILAVLAGLALMLAAGQPAGAQTAAPLVKTGSGELRGELLQDVVRYQGIPYAAPPTGDLRWRPPQPASRWSGVRDATRPGGACNQVEDCLYLNVHAPAGAEPGSKVPVMVWIHGGSFTGGAGANYDGSSFARQGIVLVTINYRLGRMGFFAHPALTRESRDKRLASYGIMDQIEALKWVRSNVSAFGGDPRNVTIFGESAGAVSINYLMVSPQARGLFHKAISQSGFGRYQSQRLDEAEQSGLELAVAAGVSGDSADALERLRALPMNALPRSSGLADNARPRPIIDGKVIPISIPDGFAQGRQAKVPFMLGGNSNEASLLPTPDPAARLASISDRRDAFLAAFDPDGKREAARIINAMVTAQQITEPDRNLARQHARTGRPAYLYYFSYLPPSQRATALGANHAAEIRYVFNTLGPTAAPEDQQVARAMNLFWAAFAKTGDPGSAGGPRWIRFEPRREASLEFASDGVHLREHHLKPRLDWAEAALNGASVVGR